MSTAAVTVPEPVRRNWWIVSPWWDLAYVVITPLVIVPVVLIVVRRWLTPEQVSLAVISFASLGHHLPGFMRAYGDRDLFRRFYLRFLLAPPLVFAMALVFSPPRVVANALNLPWQHLHGLELVLLIWGTWHGLMQVYGFMRIYDVRQGVNDRRTARLDHWLCLMVFLCGVVFSDARVFGIAKTMGESGLPIPSPDLLVRLRMFVGAASLLVLLLYLANLLRQYQQGQPVSWIKLLLIGTTGWFYWYTGRVFIDVIVGIAMFEIFHAVQYYAIVWVYNKRLFQRAGDHFGPLGFLFRDRWTMLGLYLAAIAAYSSIRFFTVDANAYIFSGSSQDGYQWLTAAFVTSSFLHFYFDGFIWKVSERKTQENLVDAPVSNAPLVLRVSSFAHAAKWGVLLIITACLLGAEKARLRESPTAEFQRLTELAKLTPDLPECHAMLCRDALSKGDAPRAVAHAKLALTLRDRSHTAHADLGLAYVMCGRLTDARQEFERAIAIAPDQWTHHCDLGKVLLQMGELKPAEQELQLATRLAPRLAEPMEQLAYFYVQTNRTEEAEHLYDAMAKQFPGSLAGELGKIQVLNRGGQHHKAVKLASFLVAGHPKDWQVLLALGASLNAAGDPGRALNPLQTALELNPASAELYYQLGLAEFQLGRRFQAVKALDKALQRDKHHFAAQLQLANTFYVLGDRDGALQEYQQALKLRPGDPTASANYGGLLTQLGMPEEAERVYRQALASNPDNGQLTYNLAVCLWQLGKEAEAASQFQRAEQLGVTLTPEVKAAIKAVAEESMPAI